MATEILYFTITEHNLAIWLALSCCQ